MKQFTAFCFTRLSRSSAALAAGLLLAATIRYHLLENDALQCQADAAGGWCRLRAVLGWTLYHQLIGLTGLALAIAAWLPALRRLALPGLLVAGCGLALYNTTYAAFATIIALLAAQQPARPN